MPTAEEHLQAGLEGLTSAQLKRSQTEKSPHTTVVVDRDIELAKENLLAAIATHLIREKEPAWTNCSDCDHSMAFHEVHDGIHHCNCCAECRPPNHPPNEEQSDDSEDRQVDPAVCPKCTQWHGTNEPCVPEADISDASARYSGAPAVAPGEQPPIQPDDVFLKDGRPYVVYELLSGQLRGISGPQLSDGSLLRSDADAEMADEWLIRGGQRVLGHVGLESPVLMTKQAWLDLDGARYATEHKFLTERAEKAERKLAKVKKQRDTVIDELENARTTIREDERHLPRVLSADDDLPDFPQGSVVVTQLLNNSWTGMCWQKTTSPDWLCHDRVIKPLPLSNVIRHYGPVLLVHVPKESR